jgi:LysM repeat protein
MEGKKFILHKVEPKETWLILSRRYKCTVAELKAANEGVEELKIGQIINVPSEGAAVTKPVPEPPAKESEGPSKTKAETSKKEVTGASVSGTSDKTPVLYTVKKGDTMYSISKKFNLNIQDIKSTNKLSSDVLTAGQVLTVGYTQSKNTSTNEVKAKPVSAVNEEKQVVLAPKVIEEPTPKSSPKTATETGVSPAAAYDKPTKSISPLKKGNSGKTLMQVTETGVATWIQDGQVNPDKYYALHRSAPIGTIVKVTNRMNNQFVYVKVVGSLPDTGENENIIIKVSQAVSSKLNALDPLFQVELSYGVMN